MLKTDMQYWMLKSISYQLRGRAVGLTKTCTDLAMKMQSSRVLDGPTISINKASSSFTVKRMRMTEYTPQRRHNDRK